MATAKNQKNSNDDLRHGIRPEKSKRRVLNASVSDEALRRSRIAALESDLQFKDYLDRLLRQAKPFHGPVTDPNQGQHTPDRG